jgi:hypothetical protein
MFSLSLCSAYLFFLLILRGGNIWHYETLFSIFFIPFQDLCGSQSQIDTFFQTEATRKYICDSVLGYKPINLFCEKRLKYMENYFPDVCSNYILVTNIMKSQITVESEAAESPSCTALFPNRGSAETQDSAKRSWGFHENRGVNK